jgi:hypothetical protein
LSLCGNSGLDSSLPSGYWPCLSLFKNVLGRLLYTNSGKSTDLLLSILLILNKGVGALRKIWISTFGLLFIILLVGCSSDQPKADKPVIKQNANLTKQQVIDKTLEKMKTAKGFKFEYEQRNEIVMNKSGVVLNYSQNSKINADYVNDNEYRAWMSVVNKGVTEEEDRTVESYAKNNKIYTKNSKSNKWTVRPYELPKEVVGADFNYFKFVDQLQLFKDNLNHVKYSEDNTTYKVEINLQDSNQIKKLVRSSSQSSLNPKSFQVAITIDKRDLHIITLVKKENAIQTQPDQKVNITLTSTLKWKGPVSSITLPEDAIKAK